MLMNADSMFDEFQEELELINRNTDELNAELLKDLENESNEVKEKYKKQAELDGENIMELLNKHQKDGDLTETEMDNLLNLLANYRYKYTSKITKDKDAKQDRKNTKLFPIAMENSTDKEESKLSRFLTNGRLNAKAEAIKEVGLKRFVKEMFDSVMNDESMSESVRQVFNNLEINGESLEQATEDLVSQIEILKQILKFKFEESKLDGDEISKINKDKFIRVYNLLYPDKVNSNPLIKQQISFIDTINSTISDMMNNSDDRFETLKSLEESLKSM